MSASTLRLLTNYRQQERAYECVLELARLGVDIVREGRPLLELRQVNEQKRELLEQVARLEQLAESDKAEWRQLARTGQPGLELEVLLARITAIIEQILRQEHETDLWILQGAGIQQGASASRTD